MTDRDTARRTKHMIRSAVKRFGLRLGSESSNDDYASRFASTHTSNSSYSHPRTPEERVNETEETMKRLITYYGRDSASKKEKEKGRDWQEKLDSKGFAIVKLRLGLFPASVHLGEYWKDFEKLEEKARKESDETKAGSCRDTAVDRKIPS